MIILAAGQGSRLAPYTNDKPKCMVRYQGKEIINYITEVISGCNIVDVAVVGGYKFEILVQHLQGFSHTFYINEKFATTNMVATLFSAESFLESDIIVSYSDIIYTSATLNKLINSKGDICVVVDKSWKELWLQRMEDPLSDAETLKIDRDGFIAEIGKKPKSYAEIEGQYIGLIKISKNRIRELIAVYHQLPKDELYDGKNYDNMFMTSFLQILISKNFKLTPVYINGGWIEIDSPEDLNSKIL